MEKKAISEKIHLSVAMKEKEVDGTVNCLELWLANQFYKKEIPPKTWQVPCPVELWKAVFTLI